MSEYQYHEWHQNFYTLVILEIIVPYSQLFKDYDILFANR